MVDKIEMSLDDIIKTNRSQNKKVGSGRGARRGGGGGGGRQVGGRRTGGVSPRKTGGSSAGGVLKGRNFGGVQKAKFARGDVNSAWKHDMYDGPRRGGILKGGNESAKLLVSNLDYGVSNFDIQELFAEFGPLIKAAVHYDRSGRSLGTADVVFERRADALKAIKQYNGVPLDGRPMNIALVTSDVAALTRTSRVVSGAPANRKLIGTTPTRRGGGNVGVRRGMVKGKRPAGNTGNRRGNKPAPTAEELDAELDAYVNDMKI